MRRTTIMGEKHIARLEPVGIELEVDEDETILDAAFRQGIMLMHGCKEGQCSSCKSFLLDGDVDLDRYSTFALPDFEEAEGYTLLCRAHALTDVEIELLHYDEDAIRSGTSVGDELTCKGPFGMFTLRDSSPRRLVFIAGGAGMAPVLSLLRSMADKGTERPATFYYGARTHDDLFALEEIERLGGELPNLTFVPALSDAEWDGETGMVTDVVDRMEDDLAEVDAYLCGPPPMVDAAIALLEQRGTPESHIYFDRFTTSAA